MISYSYGQFEDEVTALKPRPFDTYVLPAFLIYYAIRSKDGMRRNARRILFVAGVYMAYRSMREYRKAIESAVSLLQNPGEIVV